MAKQMAERFSNFATTEDQRRSAAERQKLEQAAMLEAYYQERRMREIQRMQQRAQAQGEFKVSGCGYRSRSWKRLGYGNNYDNFRVML